jgi:hypothetical protein
MSVVPLSEQRAAGTTEFMRRIGWLRWGIDAVTYFLAVCISPIAATVFFCHWERAGWLECGRRVRGRADLRGGARARARQAALDSRQLHAAAITCGELKWPLDRLHAIPSYELSG